jgi:hypothetical protein
MKALLAGSFLAIVLAITSPTAAAGSPPASERASQVKALVIKAAALVDKEGKSAFVEFRKKDSEWFHGDTYLFAYDMTGNVLLNPAFPEREGTNVTGQKDANGKLLHAAIIHEAQTEGAGWVDYVFPKPGQTEPSQKWAYEEGVDRWRPWVGCVWLLPLVSPLAWRPPFVCCRLPLPSSGGSVSGPSETHDVPHYPNTSMPCTCWVRRRHR